MPVYDGNYKIEIIDLENTSGAPVLAWVYSEGGLDDQALETTFSMKYQREGERYSVPILTRSVSSPSGRNPLNDPIQRVSYYGSSGRQISGENDDWATSPDAARISGAGYAPPHTTDSIFFANLADGVQKMVTTNIDGLDTMYGDSRARNDVIRIYQPQFRETQTIRSGIQSAWISYDVSSGVNNKRVFAYSLELLQEIQGLSGLKLQTSGDYFTPSELMFYSGFVFSGECSDISILLESTGITCKLPDELDGDDPIEVCLQSGLNSGDLMKTIFGIAASIKEAESNKGEIEGDAIDDSQIVNDPTSLSFVTYKGIIVYNKPYSGDYICIQPYTYDYSGEYNHSYGVPPPFSAPNFCFYYPQDYTNITGLVDKINAAMSGSGYNLWNKNVCTDDSLSGYFEYGGLLKASLIGDSGILIESLREGLMGRYGFQFFAADRPVTGVSQENVLKYMMPKKVTLQGANVYGAWTDLDTHSNIPWTQVKPIVVTDHLYDFVTGIPTGASGAPIPDPEPSTVIEATGGAVRRLVYQARISGKNVCNLYFDKTIDFYESPQGFKACKDDEDGDKFDTEDGDGDGLGDGTLRPKNVDYKYLKTGWKFNNVNDFNYYRLVLNDFSSETQTRNIQLVDSFFINRINLYGVESGQQLLSGSMCLVGSAYTGRIEGFTSGLLTGTLSGQADENGELCFNKTIVVGTPNGNGGVKFQRKNGQAVTDFTGLVNFCKTGEAYYEETIEGYFWNAQTNCVEFRKNVSGYIRGKGQLTGGPYAIIYDSGIPNLTGVQVVTGRSYGLLTGIVPRFAYNFTDIPAFANLTGTESGTIYAGDSGSIHISRPVFAIPTQAYSVAVSGTKEAQAVLDYGSPNSGDKVIINGLTITYNTGSGNAAPSFYKSISGLTNIINTYSSSFQATASYSGMNIYLTSTVLGDEGNLLSTSTVGSPSFGAPTFTGGTTYHYPLGATTAFTGQLELDLMATGFYSVSGSGYLTGSIKQLDFVRSFSGIWGLSSGDLDFQILGWMNAGKSKYTNSGFSTPFYSGRPDVVSLLVTYNNNPLVLTNDLARLRVTGYGVGTGIEMVLSGQY